MTRGGRRRVCVLAACAMVVLASVALAQPRPVRPAGTRPLPAKFPMTSAQFRPVFDKTVEQAQTLLGRAPDGAVRSKMLSKIERAKFRASIAMQDGMVTAAEAMGLWRDE